MELVPTLILLAALGYGALRFRQNHRARRARRRRARGLCTYCAYDLTGVDSGACPECGAPFVPPH